MINQLESSGASKSVNHETNGKRMKNFDVFVTELCDGNLSKTDTNFTLTQSVDICKQLLEGLEQLEKSEKCHNDLKPENVLYTIIDEEYKNGDPKISIKIGDFGTAGRSGGTPGWTWPKFLSERKPGRSDMYSVALLILYVMCDSRDLFYRLRDNYIESGQFWMVKFREDPMIKLVINMMNLKLSVQQCKDIWTEISDQIDVLNDSDLCMDYQITRYWFDAQTPFQIANATHLDK